MSDDHQATGGQLQVEPDRQDPPAAIPEPSFDLALLHHIRFLFAHRYFFAILRQLANEPSTRQTLFHRARAHSNDGLDNATAALCENDLVMRALGPDNNVVFVLTHRGELVLEMLNALSEAVDRVWPEAPRKPRAT